MSTSTLTRPTVATAVGAGAEMATIHSAFRRELRLAPALLRSVEHGDRLRAGIVGTHLDLLDRFLHHHHTIEDDMLWPKLLERVPAEIAPVVELMEAQHHTVAELLERTVTLRAAWRARRRPGARSRAGRDLRPAARRARGAPRRRGAARDAAGRACITAKEWKQIGKAAQRGTPLKDGPRMLGMLAYDGDPEVMREMLAAVPGPMRGHGAKVGRRAYGKHAQRVYGTPTP